MHLFYLKKNCHLIYQEFLGELDGLLEALEKESTVAGQRQVLVKIQKGLIAAQDIGDDKLKVAQAIADTIENKSRLLEHDAKNLDFVDDDEEEEEEEESAAAAAAASATAAASSSKKAAAVANRAAHNGNGESGGKGAGGEKGGGGGGGQTGAGGNSKNSGVKATKRPSEQHAEKQGKYVHRKHD